MGNRSMEQVSSGMQISVILCAHNPRPEYLARALQALRAQTLPLAQWELLLVDNASTPPVSADLAWHPHGRRLSEPRVGKTNAFLLGFEKSQGEIITIVDDDNLLSPDYLAGAAGIGAAYPGLGAWGGNVRLCFEQAPPEWTRKHWTLLAGRTVTEDAMACDLELSEPLPVGAGCCLRRRVVAKYRDAQGDPWRAAIGRAGQEELLACEDTDLVMTACDMGLQRGMFKDLTLDHLIPASRLTEDYIARMIEGIRFSCYLLELARHPDRVPPPVNAWWHLKLFAASLTKLGRRRLFHRAYKNAQRRAREYYEQHAGGVRAR
jgi:glycosyltransferase involved in cell wall biosynthesis